MKKYLLLAGLMAVSVNVQAEEDQRDEKIFDPQELIELSKACDNDEDDLFENLNVYDRPSGVKNSRIGMPFLFSKEMFTDEVQAIIVHYLHTPEGKKLLREIAPSGEHKLVKKGLKLAVLAVVAGWMMQAWSPSMLRTAFILMLGYTGYKTASE